MLNALDLVFTTTADGSVSLRSLTFDGDIDFSVLSPALVRQGNWGDYARGAKYALQERFMLKVGIRGVIRGSLPVGGALLGAQVTVVAAAFIGALLVTALLLVFSSMTRSHVMLLIIGLMLSYVVSSAITLLNFFSTAEGVQSYTLWGMGSFGGVSLDRLPLFALLMAVGLAMAISLIKPLNALLLGIHYAENLGINIRRTRALLLLSTGLLTAVSTAYCGPVTFIGLAVPHIARLLTGTANHRQLMPATLLCGSVVALLCNLLTTLPAGGRLLPLGAITPLIGAPVILFVILKKK